MCRHKNLSLIDLPKEATENLASFAQKHMRMEFTIQDDHILVSDGQNSAGIDLTFLQKAVRE